MHADVLSAGEFDCKIADEPAKSCDVRRDLSIWDRKRDEPEADVCCERFFVFKAENLYFILFEQRNDRVDIRRV